MVSTTEASLPPSRSSSFFTTTSSHDDSTVLTGGDTTSPNYKDYGALANGELESAIPTSPQANMDALQADRPGYGTCSILSSSMNLVNAMMGSGIIGLPLALYLCGFWAGIVMSITIAGFTCMAMHLLILSGVRSGQYTLADLCRSLPLCLPRSVAPLAKWSTIGVLLLPLVIIGVAIRLPAYYTPFTIVWLNPSLDQVFKGLAIMGLSYGCSQNVFGVFLSQRDQRPSQFLKADMLSISIGFMLNMTFAVFGYFCFAGGNTAINANVLLNFPADDSIINLVRLTLAIFIALTIPLALHPCRESLQKMLGHNTEGRLPTRKQHCIVTLSMFCIVLCLGATLTELGTVFAIIGGVSTTAIGFLLPGAAYMRIFLPELLCGESFKSKADQNVVGSWPLMLGAFTLVIISMPIMYFAILDAVL
ncbi:hypothetical protein LRAMOSA08930 [Lichtheimia ramosa]|uniref:Amino acid transporter transmembrane domain-containing protein n=1 Tax=Lichtheimia ramosa TaxID=688394 RepID=A0A077WIE4_9FUNG|nr:hypothetical protein LRAMOSA08930 [Lichtheimia ramosa]